MITDPTQLFQALANCLDPESNKVSDLPAASTKAIYELLEDDQPDEMIEIRAMNALAAKRLRELNLIINNVWFILLLMARTDEKLKKMLDDLVKSGGLPL